MKEKRNSRICLFALLILVFTLGFGFSVDTSKQSLAVSSQVVQADENNGILALNGQKQFVMEEKDQLGRAHSAHIQLQDKDEPKNKRPGKIKYDPVGWHNYKFYYGDGKSKSWLMNRGHLIGYQFSGVNDEGKNLVPMTAWLNSGNYKGTDEGNQSGMLYYENRLDNWLALHPNYWLDYKVTAIYSGDELLPRQVELQYVGIDSSGNLLEIKLGGDKETLDSQGVTHVVLANQSPNAEINYADGTATNTVTEFTEAPSEPSSESSQVTEQPSSEPEPAQPTQEESEQFMWHVKEQQMFIGMTSIVCLATPTKQMSLLCQKQTPSPKVNDTQLKNDEELDKMSSFFRKMISHFTTFI